MKTVIIFKSKTGFTERYAEWIKAEIDAELVPYKKRKRVELEKYDMVIFGSRFHMGMISGIGWFKKQLPRLAGKKTVVFATGASPSEAEELKNAYLQNFTAEEYRMIKPFYFRSGLSYEKMGALDKFLMAGFRSMLKKTEGENSEAYKTVAASHDVCSKELIKPLLEYVNS